MLNIAGIGAMFIFPLIVKLLVLHALYTQSSKQVSVTGLQLVNFGGILLLMAVSGT